MQQQFNLIVNSLQGDGKALKGDEDVFRAKNSRLRATDGPLLTTKRS